jgi:hypothetical protein
MVSYKKIFKNSTWIVPAKTLLAYQTIGNTSVPVSDQTVWKITEYKKGYIFGTSYATINQTPAAKMSLVGSIDSENNVLITFYSDSSSIAGFGELKHHKDKYWFVMQMNSLSTINSARLIVSHWSYMISVKPSDSNYQKLPGFDDTSVPEFIELFD